MNSPVPCLPDPIQNMNRKTKLSKKQTAKSKAINRINNNPAALRAPFLSTVNAPASYGTARGGPSKYPMGAITPRGAIVKNYELGPAFTQGSGGFTVDGFNVNPGIATNFPWLSNIAKNYQKFRFLYLRFFYSSSVSTATPGKTYISLSYDAQDGPPTSLAQAMTTENASCGPSWFGGAINTEKAFDRNMNGDANIYVDLKPGQLPAQWYYVRNTVAGTQPSSGGALTGAPTGGIGTLAFVQGSYTDESSIPVKCYYGTNGVTNALIPGELYVAYICEFADAVAPAVSV